MSRVHISKSKRCFIVKSSTSLFVIKTKILADIQICISVPLIKKTSFFCALQWNLMQNILLQITGVTNLALPSTASEA